jgi:four helix bundle protein
MSNNHQYDALMHIRPYERLIAWQEAHRLCLSLYKATSAFPSDERYELVRQMRRASYSVPMNIAEGNMKRSKKEKGRFFEIASSSLEEVHYQLVLARDLKYLSLEIFNQFDSHIHRTSYLLMKLRASLKKDPSLDSLDSLVSSL